MKLITTLSLICILPFAELFASESEHTELSIADSLRSEGLLAEAIIAYEYSAFTSLNNTDRTIALLKKAECLLESGKIERSESTLSRLNFYNLNDSLQYESRYKSALYSYLNQNFEESISQLSIIEQFLPIENSIKS